MIAVRWWCDAAAILVVGLVGAEWLRRRAQRAGVTIGHPRTLPSLLMLAAAAYAAGAAAMLAAQVALWFGADGFTDAGATDVESP